MNKDLHSTVFIHGEIGFLYSVAVTVGHGVTRERDCIVEART